MQWREAQQVGLCETIIREGWSRLRGEGIYIFLNLFSLSCVHHRGTLPPTGQPIPFGEANSHQHKNWASVWDTDARSRNWTSVLVHSWFLPVNWVTEANQSSEMTSVIIVWVCWVTAEVYFTHHYSSWDICTDACTNTQTPISCWLQLSTCPLTLEIWLGFTGISD